MSSNLLPVAKEGFRFIYTSFGLMVLFWLFGFSKLAFLALVITLFFVFVFRNPERERVVYDEYSVLSPVDGVLSSIEEDVKSDEYIIKIDSSCFDVALLRTPFDATIKDTKLIHGTRLASSSPLAKELNECCSVVFVNKNLQSIRVEHMLKQTIKSIDIDLKDGASMLQGSRYGYALNSVTTLYLPRSFRLSIGLGSELRAGEVLIGYFAS